MYNIVGVSVSKQCTAALNYRLNCYISKAFASEVSDHSTQAMQVAKRGLSFHCLCYRENCVVVENRLSRAICPV